MPSCELLRGNSLSVVGFAFQSSDVWISKMLLLCCGNVPFTLFHSTQIKIKINNQTKSKMVVYHTIVYISILPWQIQHSPPGFQNVATAQISYCLYLKCAIKVQNVRYFENSNSNKVIVIVSSP